MESGAINDNQITASTLNLENPPWKGRLNDTGFWRSSHKKGYPWIQVDLMRSTVVTGIITQGGSSYWVESLQIQFGDSKDTLMYIFEDGKSKVSLSNFSHMGVSGFRAGFTP